MFDLNIIWLNLIRSTRTINPFARSCVTKIYEEEGEFTRTGSWGVKISDRRKGIGAGMDTDNDRGATAGLGGSGGSGGGFFEHETDVAEKLGISVREVGVQKCYQVIASTKDPHIIRMRLHPPLTRTAEEVDQKV